MLSIFFVVCDRVLGFSFGSYRVLVLCSVFCVLCSVFVFCFCVLFLCSVFCVLCSVFCVIDNSLMPDFLYVLQFHEDYP